MFRLTTGPIHPSEFLHDIAESCGALVSFKGRVRNHHLGRVVTKLEYSIHPVLALKEGQQILAEVLHRFPEVSQAKAIHRHGPLAIGELAVFAFVASSHRAEAFAACQWIIDEIKRRVPIWKNEFYLDGTSEWTGCESCLGHQH